MIHHIFIHTEFSRLPRNLGHFADSNSIPWNLTTIFRPIQTTVIQLTFLLLLSVQLVLQFRLFLIYEVWKSDDSLIILHLPNSNGLSV